MRCFCNIIGCFSQYSRAALCNHPPRRSSKSSPSISFNAFSALLNWILESARSCSMYSTPLKNELSERVGTNDGWLCATWKPLLVVPFQVANSFLASNF